MEGKLYLHTYRNGKRRYRNKHPKHQRTVRRTLKQKKLYVVHVLNTIAGTYVHISTNISLV